jgi:hypothetical protein
MIHALKAVVERYRLLYPVSPAQVTAVAPDLGRHLAFAHASAKESLNQLCW